MQKKIIALAVAGLMSGAAFAQSNVTVYGIADMGYIHSTSSGQTYNGVESGNLAGSRLGFKGTEDLGGGLKAVFTLEYGLSMDINAGVGTSLARQQFVGLAGGFGQVALGRQYSPAYSAVARTDTFGATVPSPHGALVSAGGNTIAGNSAARWNNAVTYISPSFSGLSFSANYGFGQTNENDTATTDRDPRFGLGANYANGPMNFDVVYHDIEQSTAPTSDKTTELFLGGSYNFGAVKAFASWQSKNDKSATDADNKVWQLGVVAPVSAVGNLMFSYAKLSDDRADFDSKSYGIGYTHSMSKRTTLYTTYTHVSNDSLANAKIVAGTIGESNKTFAAGINHSF